MKKIYFIFLFLFICFVNIKANYSIRIDKIALADREYTNSQYQFILPPNAPIKLTITYTITKTDALSALPNSLFLYFKKSFAPDYLHDGTAVLPPLPTASGKSVTSTLTSYVSNSYNLGYNTNEGEVYLTLQYALFTSSTDTKKVNSPTWRFKYAPLPELPLPPKTGTDPRNIISFDGNQEYAAILGSRDDKVIDGNAPYYRGIYVWQYYSTYSNQWLGIKKDNIGQYGQDLDTQNFRIGDAYKPMSNCKIRRIILVNGSDGNTQYQSISNEININFVQLWSYNQNYFFPNK